MALIRSLPGKVPKIHPQAWLAENATIIGEVELDRAVSVWYQVVIRGDVNKIVIGAESNIQDGTVIHATYEGASTWIDAQVTVGHSCILHACRVGKGSLIGMGSILMDQVEVGEWSLVAAGSLITENKKFPPYSLIMGRPAVWKRSLTQEEIAKLKESAANYLMYTSWYQKETYD